MVRFPFVPAKAGTSARPSSRPLDSPFRGNEWRAWRRSPALLPTSLFTISLLTISLLTISRLQQAPRIRLELVLDHPARDLTIGREPDLGKLRHVFEQLLEDRRDHRAAAEMAM